MSEKDARDMRVQERLDELARRGQRGFYEPVFQVVREEGEREREICALICEERRFGIGCSHAVEAAQRIRARSRV